MSKKDYYKIMGLSRQATDKEIKMAYRRLARKYHPDLNKEADAEEKFKELGEAYEVLKDPKKRNEYDTMGDVHQQYQSHSQYQSPNDTQSPRWNSQWDKQTNTHFDFDPSIFESILGEHFKQQKASLKGADISAQLNISLEDAYQGATKEIQIPATTPTGSEIVRVKIPAGIQSGQKIRLAGKGQTGPQGSPNGDLYITIQIEKHPFFDINNNNIYLTLPITPWEAALGSSVVVPTLAGKVDLKIPAGSQGGQSLRLKNRGLPGKIQGDQFILLKIVIPQPKNSTDKALYQQMSELMPFNPRQSLGV